LSGKSPSFGNVNIAIVGHHSARADIGMPVCSVNIRAYIGFFQLVSASKQEEGQRAEGLEETLLGLFVLFC